MPGKFEIKTLRDGRVFFNLKAPNGRVILSSELYETKKAAENGIASVRINAGIDSRFERRIAKDGSVYFVLKASNGEIVGRSESYPTKAGMESGISTVKKSVEAAEVLS